MATKPISTAIPDHALGSAWLGRLILLVSIAASCAAVLLTTDMTPGYARDAELAGLIRTMGAIKLAAVFPLVFGAAWLRIAPGVAMSKQTVYGALTVSSAVGISFIMALSYVMLGAVMFHAGFLGMLIVAARDDGFVERLKPAAKWLLKR